MKRNDILLIIAVAFFAGTFSLLGSKFLFKSGEHNLQAQVVEPITTDFQKPDEKVFNKEAINPTQLIQIGGGSNSNPF